MKKALVIGVLLTALGGCATQPPSVRPSVDIVVPTPAPTPDVPVKPHLAISDLAPDAAGDAVISAYASSLKACVSYSAQLKTILDGYGDATGN